VVLASRVLGVSHCHIDISSLLDVEECVDSGYNILREPQDGGLYSVAYRVDEAGRDLLVELGRSNGKMGDFPACATCTGTQDDALLRGFRAEVTGVVTGLGNGTVYDPPTLRVATAVPSNGRTDVCSGRQPTTAPAQPSKPSPTPPSSSTRGRGFLSVSASALSVVLALALP
jgi:hypothetical protein